MDGSWRGPPHGPWSHGSVQLQLLHDLSCSIGDSAFCRGAGRCIQQGIVVVAVSCLPQFIMHRGSCITAYACVL